MNTATDKIRIEIARENALIIYFGEKTDPRVSSQVQKDNTQSPD